MLNDLGFILGTTLMYSTPLIYTALGGVMSENSGVVNIGLEGMMTIGAFIGATVGYYLGNPWIAFLCAGLAGGFFALLHALASVTFAADQVVSGVAINFLGPGVALFLSRIFFQGATDTKSIEFKIPRPLNGVFPRNSFLDQIFNQYATVYLAFVLVAIVWYLLYKTKLGLRIRSVGEHPKAADTLGISVYKIRYFAVIMSGIFAGFGGAAMSIAVVSNFRPTLISGQGFIALAAMIFGNWKPQGAMFACLLFGAAQGLVIYLGGTSIAISSQLLAMIPYLLTLIILMGFVGKSVAPAASGEAYEKDGN
ncbi:ABC transporter permease [Clostridiisalibacter paucivorans]|uniref:ABC transporter permease n=1 Tax=Clostridiisalibacter paucivorans TaxID=408753 RepID=UPI00047E79C2|nr:ABC transporter permease [Clostridiisalibacter paucivorans]